MHLPAYLMLGSHYLDIGMTDAKVATNCSHEFYCYFILFNLNAYS